MAEHVGPSQHPAKTKGLCKNFEGGRVYWSSRTGAHPVWDSVADLHYSLGGSKSRLGFPLSDEMPAETSPQRTTGMLQRFEGGPSTLCLWEVNGTILKEYQSIPASMVHTLYGEEYESAMRILAVQAVF